MSCRPYTSVRAIRCFSGPSIRCLPNIEPASDTDCFSNHIIFEHKIHQKWAGSTRRAVEGYGAGASFNLQLGYSGRSTPQYTPGGFKTALLFEQVYDMAGFQGVSKQEVEPELLIPAESQIVKAV